MVEIRGIRFEVEINRKKIRNLYLRLDGNRIIASVPLRMADYEVYRFIDKKRDWIYKTYNYQEYKNRVSNLYRGGEYFYIFDKPYRLIRLEGKKNVKIREDEIVLTYQDQSDQGIRYLYKYLDKMLLKKAEAYLDAYLPFLQDYGYQQLPQLKCRIMTSRWGVCHTRQNSITISSYLIHYPEKCLEYIMIHEMVHFIVPNHSRRFYELVSLNMPDYKTAVERLKL